MSRPQLRSASILLLSVLAVAACGSRDADKEQDTASQDANGLPTPAGATGVTGAADIATGNEDNAPVLGGAPAPEPQALPNDPFFSGLPADAPVNPETGMGVDPDGDGPLTAPPAQDTGAAEPTPADAVAVIRNYYASINSADHAGAYRLWRDGGRASGQTAAQFSAGFAQTRGTSVEIGAPGRVDAGAGNRYIQVPVSVAATQADGSVRRFAGHYVLQRSVVDGATADQRAWRIQGADLREVVP